MPLSHEYVPPPVAVRVVLSPGQIIAVSGITAATGNGFTVIKLNAAAVQLLASVTVTQYMSLAVAVIVVLIPTERSDQL